MTSGSRDSRDHNDHHKEHQDERHQPAPDLRVHDLSLFTAGVVYRHHRA